jgi:hypothetical protein
MPTHYRRLSKTGQAYKLAKGLSVKVPPVHGPKEEAGIFFREEFQEPVAKVGSAQEQPPPGLEEPTYFLKQLEGIIHMLNQH